MFRSFTVQVLGRRWHQKAFATARKELAASLPAQVRALLGTFSFSVEHVRDPAANVHVEVAQRDGKRWAKLFVSTTEWTTLPKAIPSAKAQLLEGIAGLIAHFGLTVPNEMLGINPAPVLDTVPPPAFPPLLVAALPLSLSQEQSDAMLQRIEQVLAEEGMGEVSGTGWGGSGRTIDIETQDRAACRKLIEERVQVVGAPISWL